MGTGPSHREQWSAREYCSSPSTFTRPASVVIALLPQRRVLPLHCHRRRTTNMNAAVQANSTLDVPSGVHDESTGGQAAQLSTARLKVASTKTRTADLLQVPRLNEWSRWAGEPPRSDSSQSGVEVRVAFLFRDPCPDHAIQSRAEDVASVATSMKDGIRVNRGEQVRTPLVLDNL